MRGVHFWKPISLFADIQIDRLQGNHLLIVGLKADSLQFASFQNIGLQIVSLQIVGLQIVGLQIVVLQIVHLQMVCLQVLLQFCRSTGAGDDGATLEGGIGQVWRCTWRP